MNEFRPLDGTEIASLALRLLAEAFDKDLRFKEHRAFNSGTLVVTVQGHIVPESVDGLEKSIEIDLEAHRAFGTTQEGAPDAIRQELGLDILEPSLGPQGQLIDKPKFKRKD